MMVRSIPKTRLIILAVIVFGLAGCGRKPTLDELKAPSPQNGEGVFVEPAQAAKIDGSADGVVPVAQAKPRRAFLLDFLL